MKLRKGQILDLEIESMAFGGAGVSHYEGMAIFVDKVVPGDKVRASLKRIKPRFAEAELIELVYKSPMRVEPRCAYFEKCGGCQFQSLPYEDQLALKKQHVIDTFERIGKLQNPPVNEPIGSKDQYFYRNKMEFSFGYDEEMNFALGLHVPGRRFDILDLNECHLQSEFTVQILNNVREFCLANNWMPRKIFAGEGFLRSLIIREGKRTGEVLVNIATVEEVPDHFLAGFESFRDMLLSIEPAESEKSITSILWSRVINRRGEPKRIEEKIIYGKDVLTEHLELRNGDQLSFDIKPQAFFQVNTYQAEVLYSQVIDLALQKPIDLAFDLFCGTGTIGMFLSKHASKVVGVEMNSEAVEAAKINLEKNDITNMEFFVGNVADILKDLTEKPSLIVIDPPRAGLTEKMVNLVNDFGTERLIYISCNPGTLARDTLWFKDLGFEVKEIRPVDMFPNTYHIECVCLLERV